MNRFTYLALVFLATSSLTSVAYSADSSQSMKPKDRVQAAPAEEPAEMTGTIKPYVEEDELEDQEERVSVSDVDFSTVESFGLLEHNDGLGKQLYSYSKRSAITALVQAMPPANWITTRDLTNQVLLTSANTGAMENDVPVDYQKGHDLLTVRIEKLLQRGLNHEAYAIYTRMKTEPFNAKIAHLGVISMLMNGQKPLACVEIKTMPAALKDEAFWKEMDAYCVVSLSGEKTGPKVDIIKNSKEKIMRKVIEDKSFHMPYTPMGFERLSLFERSVLIAENRLDISGLTDDAYKFIPAAHIQALLSVSSMDNKARILLTAQGVEKGVMTPYDLKNLYIKIGRKAEKEKKALSGFEHISTVFWKRADTFEPAVRQASVAEVFSHSQKYGYVLLVPFLEEISKFGPADSFSIEQIQQVIKAYLVSGQSVPVQWLDVIQAIKPKNQAEEKTLERLLVASALLSADKDNNNDKLTKIYSLLEKPKNTALENLKNIIENIDNRTGNYAKVRYVYEKGFDLEGNKSYTMPPAGLLDQLELSSKSHAMGETVLLCNLILQGIEQKTVYAGILADVARALSEVGLGKQSQRVVAEAVLGIEN